MRWFYLCMAVIRKFDCMAGSYVWRPRLRTWLCAYVHTYIHIGERLAARPGATFRRPAYMYWWTRSQNALTVTYEKIVRAMVERCEWGQKWAHFFFFCASYHLAWLLPSLGVDLLPSHGLRLINLLAAAAATWRFSLLLFRLRAQVQGPVFITRPLNDLHHRERKKKKREMLFFRTNL